MGVLDGIFYMLWRGLAIGIIISAPMGPVGILCVQRTLAKGRKAGFYTGVGAAISDLFYCLMTGFGLSFIEEFLEENQNTIQLLGSLVLIAFGVYLFMSNPSKRISKPGEDAGSPKRDIINGFLFTVSNPLIIFLIIGLFARFNFLLPDIRFYQYIIGFVCIILGALGWWWLVTAGVNKVRAHFNLRSMWLINKITGSIIGLFGVVGIITSITGIANAAEPQYWNSGRGFGDLTHQPELTACYEKPVTLFLNTPEFELDFRARNLHNKSGKKYDGVLNPSWTLIARNFETDDSLRITFKTIDDIREALGPKSLSVTVSHGDSVLAQTGLRDHVDWYTGWNSWRLSHEGNAWRLTGGEREYHPVLEWDWSLRPTELFFETGPAGLIELDWLRLQCADPRLGDNSYIANPDVLKSYLNHSDDPLEGTWRLFDRTLDENTLRLGGDYTLAIVANDKGGYDMIYLAGAEKNVKSWIPGTVKGEMVPTAFRNVYSLEWRDAEGNPIQSETKAEFQSPDMLNIQIPYLNSSFRLRKTN